MGKDSKYLPTLTRDNHEDWFRRAKVKIKSKGMFYVIETTRIEFAWIQREGGIKLSANTPSTDSTDGVADVTNQFERLGGSWNLEKAKTWDQDDAKAIEIIIEGLGENNAVLIDEYEIASAVWTQLKLRYKATSSATANQYMTNIQNFILGVNLISAKKLCKGGYQGAFDEENIWITRGHKRILTAEQSHGLYIVKHISKKYQNKTIGKVASFTNLAPSKLASTKVALLGTASTKPTSRVIWADQGISSSTIPLQLPENGMPAQVIIDFDTDSDSDNGEATKEKELARYLKYHRRFAHLGPEKIRNLYKVTILKKKIKIPSDINICDTCAITKMRNKIPKELNIWPTEILELVQFDVAGPFPPTIRENRYFLVEDRVILQSITIASLHQNGPAERSIQIIKFDMRAMLEEAQLPIEFWDKAAEADSYMRNRTATGPKAIPAGERHDKLVNPGRVGVFMDYSNDTTKHFKVYSPKREYIILLSRVIIKKSTNGGTVNLRLRNCTSGSQGTMNVAPDRKPRDRSKKVDALPEIIEVEAEPEPTTVQIKIPTFTPPADIPMFTEDNMPDKDAFAKDRPKEPKASELSKPIVEEVVEKPTNPQDVEMQNELSANPQDEGQKQTSLQTEPVAKESVGEIPNTTEPPRYFMRPNRKRSGSDLEEQGNAKRIRAMIAQLLANEVSDQDFDKLRAASDSSFEKAFPAKVIAGIKIPRTYKEAIEGNKHADKWREAMAEEMLSLHANGTFREVIAPKGANFVSSKWVYTIKTTSEGKIERFKARLIAKKFSQIHKQDYDQTFAPTVRMDTLKLFLAVVAAKDLKCRQYDIKNAFTESYLKKEIYIKPPQGISVKKGRVWQALKSLYGFKQAARDWNRLIKDKLINWGFTQSRAKPYMFTHGKKSIKLLIYVNNIVAAAKQGKELDWFYKKLLARFNAKNLGKINKILGARVTRDRQNRILEIDQKQYFISVLDKFGIIKKSFKPKKIPARGYKNLRPANDKDKRINVSEYQQAIGSLMYAIIFTRPDIAFILGKLSQFMSDPARHHDYVLKLLFRYLKLIVTTKLRFAPRGKYRKAVLYLDANWAGDKVDRKNIAYHFIRDLVKQELLKVNYIPTANMVADDLTKLLEWVAFKRFKDQMDLIEKPKNKS
ncbi:hypothetical protein B7494_g4697 [Chlorociboria aeruginascens]|nr:hypothetical protein B7494_g4697 [Chlorociboria aeruginascens]